MKCGVHRGVGDRKEEKGGRSRWPVAVAARVLCRRSPVARLPTAACGDWPPGEATPQGTSHTYQFRPRNAIRIVIDPWDRQPRTATSSLPPLFPPSPFSTTRWPAAAITEMSGLGNYTSKRAENENPIPHTFSFLQARQTLPRGLRWADWRLAVALIAARRLAGAVEEGAPASSERGRPPSTPPSSPPAEASDGRASTSSVSSMTAP